MKVYIVRTESHAEDGEKFDVYESYEDAKEHNNEGHWSHHALFTATFHESND